MDAKSEDRDLLRYNIKKELERYLGYAEDVHDDRIAFNRLTQQVFTSYHGNFDQNPNCLYYSTLSLIKRTGGGLWFEPDEEAIEVVVQDIFPTSEITSFVENATKAIEEYLASKPITSLKGETLSVTLFSHEISCYNEAEVEEYDVEEESEEDFCDFDECATYPLKKFVRLGKLKNTINKMALIKLALEHFPQNQ